MCLHRAKQPSESLQKLFVTVLASKRFNDASFIATLLRDQEVRRVHYTVLVYSQTPQANGGDFVCSIIQLLVQAYSAREDWRAVHYFAKQSSVGSSGAQTTACIDKWNSEIRAPTSSWKAILEAQHIRPPEVITLAGSGFKM